MPQNSKAHPRTPARPGRRWLRGGLGVVLIFAAIFATLGEGEESGTGSGSSGKKADTPAAVQNDEDTAGSETAAPESSPDNPIPLGTEIEVAKDWMLTVNSAELDGNATVAAGNQFMTPDEGKQYVLVNVTLTNNSDQPGSPMMNVRLSLLPPSGVAVDSALVVSLADEIQLSADMQPGASMTGVIPFEVNSADVAGTVLLGQSQFTLDKAKDQKFFAIQ